MLASDRWKAVADKGITILLKLKFSAVENSLILFLHHFVNSVQLLETFGPTTLTVLVNVLQSLVKESFNHKFKNLKKMAGINRKRVISLNTKLYCYQEQLFFLKVFGCYFFLNGDWRN